MLKNKQTVTREKEERYILEAEEEKEEAQSTPLLP